jgi:hypothetical protein
MLLPTLLIGQSLGDVAKKEKKRREKNQQNGAKVRVIVEDEVSSQDPEEPPVSDSDVSPHEAKDPSSAPTEEAFPSAKDQDPAVDRRREEAEWRGRVSEARERLSSARERYEYLAHLHLTPGEYYVDENGNPVIGSLEELRQLVSEAKEELDAASQALDDLKEQARRAGVPAGWLR